MKPSRKPFGEPPNLRCQADPWSIHAKVSSVGWTIRSAVFNLLAFVMLASGVLIPLDIVLCLGPRNHCHLEVVVGGSCNNVLAERQGAAPRLPDGCPRGSKDFRLSIDSHRMENSRLIGAPAAISFFASCLVQISDRSSSILFSGFSVTRKPQHSTIVLRC